MTDKIKQERDELHRILREVLAALDNGSGATERASIEFLSHVPAEVRGVVAKLREESAEWLRLGQEIAHNHDEMRAEIAAGRERERRAVANRAMPAHAGRACDAGNRPRAEGDPVTDTASLSPILAALHAYCRRDGLVNYQAWQREPFPSELDGHRWLVATNWTCLFAVLSDERVPPTLAVPPEHKPLLRSFLTPPAAVRRAEVLLLSELRAWAGEVPPPPPPPPDCAKCKNIGSVQCSRCEGEGECSCDCGDQHDCGKCNGNGYIDCGCAWKAKAVADKKEEVEQGTLLGIVFDRCLFREALSIAPCEQITVYAPADPERHPTLLSCDGWRLAVMPLHALTPKDGAWPRL